MYCLLVVGAITLSALPPGTQQVTRDISPVLVREYKPNYTEEARRRQIEGIVVMDAVVLEDGTVGGVAVTRSLDKEYGLDEEAVKTLKKWLFKPATRDGKPIQKHIFVEMSFNLPR
jgi:periplasmic protein TonB